jgi:hypothetical protein
MATINELGRNSASITYGGTGTGADLWPTFALVDQWLRNDTLQGTATASSTTVTGFGSIFITQVRAGDVIMIAGQMRTVASTPTSDTSLSVTVAFSPAITTPSAIKVINTTLTGTSDTTVVRENTYGTVSVTKDSRNVVGANTYFLSDATNSVTAISMAGTVSLTSGANTITGSGTSFVTGQGTANGLYPGDSITVVSTTGVTYFYVVDSVTNDTTAILASNASANVSGGTITKATNGVAGRTININGRIRQIESISSNTLMTVRDYVFDFTDSNLRYRTYARGTMANAVSGTLVQSTGVSSSGTTLTVGATLTGVIPIGAVLGLGSGTGTPVAGTIIVDQQYGATGTGIATTTATGSSGTNSITVASATGLLVGQLISGNGATVSGIPNSTYVTSISGTTLTLSKNLTGNLSSTSVTFFTPGGTGVYTISQTPTVAYSAATVQFGAIIGTGVNFAWDLVTGDQVWIGDELRTINFPIDGTGIQSCTTGSPINLAYTTDYSGYAGAAVGVIRQILQGIPFRREETYINGLGTAFTTELRVGDDLIIDGTEVTVTQILSNTRFRIGFDFTHTLSTSSTFYKKKKIHGYVLEGTRDGGTTAPAGSNLPGTKWSQATTMLATTNQVYPIGTTNLTVASAPTVGQYNFIKISGAGGPPVTLSGVITASTSTITGTGTSFLTQLHVGAEIYAAGQYLVVTAIASDTSATVQQTVTITNPAPFQRTVPLYTFIASIAGAVITLGHPTRNTIYATASNPALVYTCNTGGDFIEYIYSCPNKSAESSTLLFNTSLDRKYVGFRFYPLMQNATTLSGTVVTGYTPTSTSTITTSLGGWNTPVYERWVAAHAQTNGVGINLADCSGGSVMIGAQTTTTFTLNNLIAGSITIPATSAQHTPTTLGIAANSPTALASGTLNQGTSTYTAPSNTIGASSVVIGAIGNAFDTQIGSQTSGGFLYLFANPRYFILQGKSFANIPTNWIGVVEFERAQPEDTGTGFGTTTGVSYNTFSLTAGVGGSQTVQGMGASAVLGIPSISPWPCFGYINGARLPVGASQYPTLPNAGNAPVHGNVIAVPRVRNSASDLVGVNSHTYSALTITTGRWGHQTEFGATGAYVSPGTPSGSTLVAQPVDMIPQIHMGQIVPTFTNVYNAKRFMFSPVVVLGPAYDPDVRGRLYGMKVIPSGLGTLMDTVSITIDSNLFYDSAQTAADHWVLSASVQTYRMTLRQSTSQIQQSWRSLEDGSTQATNGITTYNNSFRFAVPA